MCEALYWWKQMCMKYGLPIIYFMLPDPIQEKEVNKLIKLNKEEKESERAAATKNGRPFISNSGSLSTRWQNLS